MDGKQAMTCHKVISKGRQPNIAQKLEATWTNLILPRRKDRYGDLFPCQILLTENTITFREQSLHTFFQFCFGLY